ncbi:hypothetical protein [Yoonia vestfoldensis]|nr:hypothetical protein [Yoonia vestfoldensis]
MSEIATHAPYLSDNVNIAACKAAGNAQMTIECGNDAGRISAKATPPAR